MWTIISWTILGLIAGFLAKWIMPGRDPGGLIVTILIGVAGGLVGGYIGQQLGLGTVGGFLSIGSIILATGGAVLLLFVYRQLRK